jgi:hypothetical protein
LKGYEIEQNELKLRILNKKDYFSSRNVILMSHDNVDMTYGFIVFNKKTENFEVSYAGSDLPMWNVPESDLSYFSCIDSAFSYLYTKYERKENGYYFTCFGKDVIRYVYDTTQFQKNVKCKNEFSFDHDKLVVDFYSDDFCFGFDDTDEDKDEDSDENEGNDVDDVNNDDERAMMMISLL